MTDYMVRATAADAQIRAFAVTSRELVDDRFRDSETRWTGIIRGPHQS